MSKKSWVSKNFDPTTPSTARTYDFLLGGKDNFAADREAAAMLLSAHPGIRDMAIANRKFVHRAVRLMAGEGIRQYIDLGTGIPTSPSVDETAREADPDAKVLYVDNDPVVITHCHALRTVVQGVAALAADIRDPQRILNDPITTNVIDFDRPVGVLFALVLHTIPDSENPYGIVTAFRERVAKGSHFAISVATNEEFSEQQASGIVEPFVNSKWTATLRNRAQIEKFFDGLELIEPGVVKVSSWRGEGRDAAEPLAGVAVKR